MRAGPVPIPDSRPVLPVVCSRARGTLHSLRGPLQLEEQPWLRVRNAETSPTTANPLGTDLPGVGAGHQPKLETGADTGGVQGLRDPG